MSDADVKEAPPEIKPGAYIEVAHPFARNEGGNPDWEWRPGVRNEQIAPDDFAPVADGIGTQVLSVVAVYKPGRYQTRVFYTRRWRDPDGNEFGRGVLRVSSIQQFRRIIAGYRHEFELVGDDAPVLEPIKVRISA